MAGRGRGKELTRPAWMQTGPPPPSLSSFQHEIQPGDWQSARTADGRLYWYSKSLGKTTWEDPNRQTQKSASPHHTSMQSGGHLDSKISQKGRSDACMDAASETDDWKEHKTNDGRVYFYNIKTRETRWTRPSGLSSTHKENGYNPLPRRSSETGAQQSPKKKAAPTLPRQNFPAAATGSEKLPAGWIRCKTPEGKTYFYHETTRETRWDMPPTIKADPTSPKTSNSVIGAHISAKSLPNDYSATSVASKSEKASAQVSEDRAPLPPGWVEYKTQEGRPYYYHAATAKTSWDIPKISSVPEPLPAGVPPERRSQSQRERSGSPIKRPRNIATSEERQVRRPRDSDGKPLSNKASEKYYLVRAKRRRASAAVSLGTGQVAPEKAGKSKENAITLSKGLWADKEVFEKMLIDHNITVKHSWLEAMEACADDERYLSLSTYGLRKSAFHNFMQKAQRKERREATLNALEKGENFLKLLREMLSDEPPNIRSLDNCRSDLVAKIRSEPEFMAVEEESMRQSLIRAFFDERQKLMDKQRATHRKKVLDTLRLHLDSMTDPSIRPPPKPGSALSQEERQHILSSTLNATAYGGASGVQWLTQRSSFRDVERRLSSLSLSREVNQKDIVILYDDWLKSVDRCAEERRAREREARKSLQRDNRAKFRTGVTNMFVDGKISFRAQWREVATIIAEEPFACAEGELGARPADLFKDAKDLFDKKVQDHKEEFRDLVKQADITVSDNTTIEELSTNKELSDFLSNLPKPIGEALLLDRKKREAKKRERATSAFEAVLRDLFRRREIGLDSSIESIKTNFESKEEYATLVNLTGEKYVQKTFMAFVERRREKEERRSKRKLEDQDPSRASRPAMEDRVKRQRLSVDMGRNVGGAMDNPFQASRDDDSGWAAALSVKPLSEAEKAAERERKKREILATLGGHTTAAKTSTDGLLPRPSENDGATH